jgi:hypothetical protein
MLAAHKKTPNCKEGQLGVWADFSGGSLSGGRSWGDTPKPADQFATSLTQPSQVRRSLAEQRKREGRYNLLKNRQTTIESACFGMTRDRSMGRILPRGITDPSHPGTMPMQITHITNAIPVSVKIISDAPW